MDTKAIPDALPRIRAAIDAGILTSGTWGEGTSAVCMMSAAVPGADCPEACVTAGWPGWLARLNVDLFDARVGADDEDKARQHFALSVAEAVASPVNFDKARDLFLIRRLDTGDHSALKTLRALNGEWVQQIEAVRAVVALLRRRGVGADVTDTITTAAHAASHSGQCAFGAAAYAAHAAAYAAHGAATGAASHVASAAGNGGVLTSAYSAANVAARADLIWALTEARI